MRLKFVSNGLALLVGACVFAAPTKAGATPCPKGTSSFSLPADPSAAVLVFTLRAPNAFERTVFTIHSGGLVTREEGPDKRAAQMTHEEVSSAVRIALDCGLGEATKESIRERLSPLRDRLTITADATLTTAEVLLDAVSKDQTKPEPVHNAVTISDVSGLPKGVVPEIDGVREILALLAVRSWTPQQTPRTLRAAEGKGGRV